ncbi:hypothetical protein AUC68_13975 [Methyloceanibacter methanicus]|uniref:Uncharacterized protein n=1 Tax=Methyloceanibacter methanicus TaxID=1774968 RepID=A0A1E3W4I1_9HYPH|nr:hypothetical protein [Methyloceanibacter methanicus]ODS00694.1 hypothetical protein AUC68_13975 [Methyloceanibacter methanicus]
MSESYVTTESASPLRSKAVEATPQTGARFTPLRSAIVVRAPSPRTESGDSLSPLVPLRRPKT